MKSFITAIPLLLAFLLLSCKDELTNKYIEASSNNAQILLNGKVLYNNWTITPDLKPDVLPIEALKNKKVFVHFKTDIDSFERYISLGDTVDFTVLLNKKDSALTRVVGVPPKVNFTKKYIQQNKGKWSVEINEVQELFQIIAVITPTGLADTRSMIINHDSTDYYLSVLDKFLPYKNEPIVQKIDSLLKKNWYINLKADANALEFKMNNTIGKTDIYDRMRGSKNLLEPYLGLMNDFAKKSNFRAFFKENSAYYNSLMKWHEEAISTKKQWDWLEQQFPDHYYDNYRITFSPLVKGNHSTVRFNNNGFRQAIMFIRPPYKVKNVNENVSNGLITRFVFTEIDHNYVNPETDKYIEQINDLFADREKWTNGRESKGYTTAYTIFNEYMTWSVYLLYCYDMYSAEDFNIINDRIVKYIVNRRGFHQFKAFHNTLLKLYKNKAPEATIANLYPALLQWARNYKT